MVGDLVARVACGVPEIFQHEYPDRAGAAAPVTGCLDLTDEPVDVLALTHTDFGQRVPQLRFQAHAVRPRSATTFRLIKRLLATAAPHV
jgi:hypothetical protein